MKCLVCHGDVIEITQVNEEFPVGNDVVYLAIEVPVCRTCGERYYDRKTIRRLEGFEADLRAGKVDLREVGKVLTSA
jgi:YgiT-type zinc finger domain-containing protein